MLFSSREHIQPLHATEKTHLILWKLLRVFLNCINYTFFPAVNLLSHIYQYSLLFLATCLVHFLISLLHCLFFKECNILHLKHHIFLSIKHTLSGSLHIGSHTKECFSPMVYIIFSNFFDYLNKSTFITLLACFKK